MTYRRPPLRFGHRLLCLLLAWGPPLALLFAGGRVMVDRLDVVLSKAAPLAAAEASRALEREVRIGSLSPRLTVRGILEMASRLPEIGLFTVTADDVAVANGRTLAGSGALATARRATFLISIPRLLAGDVSAAVRRITVESPHLLLIRNANGRLNVQELVRPRKKPPGKPFRTVVVVHDGRLTFRDFAARLPASRLPAVNRFSEVRGTVNLTGTRTVRFEGSGRAAPGTPTARRLGGRLALSGSAARGEATAAAGGARALLSVKAPDAAAPYWLDYFFNLDAVRVAAGRADVDMTIAVPRSRPGAATAAARPLYDGTVRLRGGRVAAPQLPVPLTDLNAALRFNVDAARGEATATLFGQRVAASGALWGLLQDEKQLALTLNMPRVPVGRAVAAFLPRGQRLPEGLALGGVGALAADVSGSLRSPIVSARVFVPTVAYRDVRAADVTANVDYAGGIVSVEQARGRLAGGTLSASATVQVAEAARDGGIKALPAARWQAAFTADLDRIDLGRIASGQEALRGLSGRGSVEAVGKYENGALTAAANVVSPGAAIRDVRIYEARARVTVEEGRIFVPALVAVTSAGAARIGGSVTPGGAVALDVSVVGLDVGRIARAFGQEGVQGVVYASGSVRGTVRDPVLYAANVQVLEPGYRDYQADFATGSFTATRDRIVLGDDVAVRDGLGRAVLSGAVRGLGSGSARLDLTASAEKLQISELLRRSGQQAADVPDVTGIIDVPSLRITGTTENPQVSGSVEATRLLVGEYAISGGSLAFAYRDGTATVTQAVLRDERVGSLLVSRLQLGAQGRLSGRFRAEKLNLAPLSALLPPDISLEGIVSLEGTVGGTRTRPIVEAAVSPENIAVAGVPLSEIEDFRLRYVADTAAGQGTATLPRLVLRQNGTSVVVSDVSYRQPSNRLTAVLSGQTEEIQKLLSTLRESSLVSLNALPRNVSGSISVERIALSVRLTPQGLADLRVEAPPGPGGEANIRARDFQVAQSGETAVNISGALVGDVLTLDQFTVESEAAGTTIYATGSDGGPARVDLGGEIDVVLESNRPSLDLLQAFLPGDRVKLSGPLQVLTVSAEGPTDAPTVRASVLGRDISVNGVPVDLLRATVVAEPTAAGADTGAITIREFLLEREEHRVAVSGTVPFSYDNPARLPADRPIDVRAAVSEQGLDLIALFAPLLPQAARPFAAEGAFGGTLSAAVSVTGTPSDPSFSGSLTVVDGSYNPPRDARSDDFTVNSIRDLDVNLLFDGKDVTFETFRLTPGGPNGQRGDFGSFSVDGRVSINDLRLLAANGGRQDALRGVGVDLTARFNRLRVVTENLLGNGEAVRGTINGNLRVAGALPRPRVTTPSPIVISDAYLQPPTEESQDPAQPFSFGINPAFDIALVTDKKAVISNGGSFRVEVDGRIDITGTLNNPAVLGDLEVIGGTLRFPTALFRIQRGGVVAIRYRPPEDPNLTFQNLVARATVYAPEGVEPDLGLQGNQGILATARPPSSGRTTRYRITAEINGPLEERSSFRATSDPPLGEAQILALLGTQRQIELVAQGDVKGALQQGFSQVFSSSIVPSLLSPIEQSVATALGFEEFALDYNPGSLLTLRLVKRFPDPFDDLLIAYTRSVGSYNAPNLPDPYSLSLYYELPRRLRFGTNLQIGFTLDAQKGTTYFLRGSRSF